jgi:hypothetical protein
LSWRANRADIRGMPIKVKCEIVVVGWMAAINCPPRVDFTTLPAPRCQLLGTKRPTIAILTEPQDGAHIVKLNNHSGK